MKLLPLSEKKTQYRGKSPAQEEVILIRQGEKGDNRYAGPSEKGRMQRRRGRCTVNEKGTPRREPLGAATSQVGPSEKRVVNSGKKTDP